MKYSTIIALLASLAIVACNQKKQTQTTTVEDTPAVAVKDSAVYGKITDATSMNSIQVLTDDGKNRDFIVDDENGSEVLGGLLSGDRFTLTFNKTDDGDIVTRALNLTTLCGHWTSLDRNFEILEDGTVVSRLSAESHPYTAWTTVNAHLVLNTDTFTVVSLGADSLSLENDKGIFVYKRQK